eukprot:Clim_evm10s19 gene=Clim_evmTU10s19
MARSIFRGHGRGGGRAPSTAAARKAATTAVGVTSRNISTETSSGTEQSAVALDPDWSQRRKIRIGCSSGFWGDSILAIPQLIERVPDMDYLVGDYLSEITMALLAKSKARGRPGHISDLRDGMLFTPSQETPLSVLSKSEGDAQDPHRLLRLIAERNLRFVANAGGLDPIGCAKELRDAFTAAGIAGIKFAAVTGDDVLPLISGEGPEQTSSSALSEMDGSAFTRRQESYTSVNAYLGAVPIAQALLSGAQIVVTGRCADSSLVLGPCLAEFESWRHTGDSRTLDLFAQASAAGHVVECGAQCTGGIFTDWASVPNHASIGFPVADIAENGTVVISKPRGTGGLVSIGSVSEQLTYEIGDPASYLLPDITVDFTDVKLQACGVSGETGALELRDASLARACEDDASVVLTGVRGKPASDRFKVCATYDAGYRAQIMVPIVGHGAAEKAYRFATHVVQRTNSVARLRGWQELGPIEVQAIGTERASYGDAATAKWHDSVRETALWCVVRCNDRRTLGLFAKECAPQATGGPVAVLSLPGGRPKPSPVLACHMFLIDKDAMPQPQITLLSSVTSETDSENQAMTTEDVTLQLEGGKVSDASALTLASGLQDTSSTQIFGQCPPLSVSGSTVPLRALAYGRSGDKGNNANIGVIARHPDYFPLLSEQLTPERVWSVMRHLSDEPKQSADSGIVRYDIPGLYGFNFVMPDSLGGGGTNSMRLDPQGKGYASVLLDMPITLPGDQFLRSLRSKL